MREWHEWIRFFCLDCGEERLVPAGPGASCDCQEQHEPEPEDPDGDSG